MAEQSLEFFAGSHGGSALGMVTGFLDFIDFLNLSSTCQRMRSVLLSRVYFWAAYYESRAIVSISDARVSDRNIGVDAFTHGDTQNADCKISGSGIKLNNRPVAYTDEVSLWQPSTCRCTYNIKRNWATLIWFYRLKALARLGGVTFCDPPLYGNPFVDLAVRSAAASRKIALDADIVKKLTLLTIPLVAAPEIDTVGLAPFTVVSRTRFFYFDAQYKFCEMRASIPTNDDTRISVLACRWGRTVNCTRCGSGTDLVRRGPASSWSSSRRSNELQPLLSLLYRNGPRDVAVSVYEYGINGIGSKPLLTRKVPNVCADIACLDAVHGTFCDHYAFFVGYGDGNICVIQSDLEETYNAASEAIVSLTAFATNNEWLLSAHLSGGNVLILRFGRSWECIRVICDVSSFAIHATRLAIGYSRAGRCKVSFGAITGPDVEIGVSRPPSRILCLHRRSLWAVIIRNYVKLVQVVGSAGTTAAHHVRALNGHLAEITACHADGWSRLVSVDTSSTLIVWDFIQGVKLLSISLLRASEPTRVPRSHQGTIPKTMARKRPSVNRQVSYSSIYNVKKDFNAPPKMASILSEPVSESDTEDLIGDVVRLRVTAIPSAPNRHTVHLLPNALCVYYHNSSHLQLLSFT
ncbi:uncharacterized protein BXIN_2934 [Babesia sp. Xinjiang]|uniref:uncharacterized protein n=1 Tax=Babesia sp. Xinjiang TaxID=462227 RepID=UPI000A21C1A2|nr:uncharacterized protein BXIN_2934 [Babesia sp. Xinjiang]ORM39512.1 hypothetical protein BXIN_2934 [Babesia sp. Xinjiang]